MPHFCKSVGCLLQAAAHKDFCTLCENRELPGLDSRSMSERNPQAFKSVGDMSEVDVYAVHHIFQIPDPSGCLQHASRLLLLAGASTNQSIHADVREARDILNRWLQLNEELVNS